MDFVQKVFVVSDSGKKIFKDTNGKDHDYRLLTVVGDSDINPVRVSVGLDSDIKLRTEVVLDFSLKADYQGNLKLRAILPVK